MREEVISTLLGYTSIACWLGAQFPQIIVNWRRKSVDGLALPFLANWLLGDTTNLIGCLLTDQLPFQTYLATYFVIVDVCLVSQYLYYDAPRHVKSISVVTSSSSAHQSRASLVTHSPLEAHAFRRGQAFRSRSVSYSADPSTAVNITLAPSELDHRLEGSMTSDVDANGSQRRWRRGSRRASSLMGLPESVVADPWERHWETRRYISPERDDTREESIVDAESESSPSVLVDSCYSEGGGRARGRGKRVSWTRESPGRHDIDHQSRLESQLLDDVPSSSTVQPGVRGRQLTRSNVMPNSPVAIEAPTLPEVAADLPRARRASAASAVSAAASRRSASIVFLAVFALFGLSSSPLGIRSSGLEGRVLSVMPHSIPDGTSVLLPPTHSTALSIVTEPDSVVHLSRDVAELLLPSEDIKRLTGRVSAWTCTTLYITSRLPQIWKNFVRRSVKGLSMYLFIFAFLGNFFYVLSILTSPKMDLPEPQARHFIRDSVPYLLGSGGTLLFDITILVQSFIYDPKRRGLRSNRARRMSLVVSSATEEEQRVLLGADRRVEYAC